MKSFVQFLESKIFQLPSDILNLINEIYRKVKILNKSEKDFRTVFLGSFPDQFSDKDVVIYAVKKHFGQGGFGIVDGVPTIILRIPMTNFDTIYHEFVHAFDPKLRKGISKHKVHQDGPFKGMQDNSTPHEIDAKISGILYHLKKEYEQMNDIEKQNFLNQVKSDSDFWDRYGLSKEFLQKHGWWERFLKRFYNLFH